MINKIDLTGHDTRKMEVIANTDKAQKKSTSSKDTSGKSSGKGGDSIGTAQTRHPADRPSLPCLRTGTPFLREGRENTRLAARFRKSVAQPDPRRFAVGRP
jgi:hypothetical protein